MLNASIVSPTRSRNRFRSSHLTRAATSTVSSCSWAEAWRRSEALARLVADDRARPARIIPVCSFLVQQQKFPRRLSALQVAVGLCGIFQRVQVVEP